jgi:DNA/RNA-binding domain of Phe-tRNA-synthetase-like protein
VSAGEYAGMDDEKILCRLDVRQCAETRITKETERFLVYVQGNEATPSPALHTGIRQIGDLAVEIWGGRSEVRVPLARARP